MEAMRTHWPDDRIDDLKEQVTSGFAKVDKQFEKVDERFKALEDEVKTQGAELRAEINRQAEFRTEMNARLDTIERRFQTFDQHFRTFEHRFQSFDQRFRTFEHRFDALLATMLTGFAGLIVSNLLS